MRFRPGNAAIARFEFLGQRQRELIVRKPAVAREAFVERIFARVAERRMADVVKQGQRLDQVFVQPQRPADRAGDRGDLVRVRQPRAVIVPHLAGEDLHLAAQPAKRRRVHDPVAVALKRPPVRMLLLRMPPPPRLRAMHRIPRQQTRLAADRRVQ